MLSEFSRNEANALSAAACDVGPLWVNRDRAGQAAGPAMSAMPRLRRSVRKRWPVVKGLGRVKTKSNLVVAQSGGGIFAFFCSERDHKPQNSGCGYTA